MDELTQKQKKRAIDAYFAIKLIAGNPNNDTRIFAVYAAGMADARAALAEPQGEPEPAKQDAAVEALKRVIKQQGLHGIQECEYEMIVAAVRKADAK
jgi:hypothetical protein